MGKEIRRGRSVDSTRDEMAGDCCRYFSVEVWNRWEFDLEKWKERWRSAVSLSSSFAGVVVGSQGVPTGVGSWDTAEWGKRG